MSDVQCSVQGCERLTKALTFCSLHYQRFRKHGDPGPAELLVMMDHPDGCAVDGCDRPYRAGGYCYPHYKHARENGDPGPLGPLRPVAECSVDGCNKPSLARTFCKMHYRRFMETGDTGPAGSTRIMDHPDTCTLPGCDRPYVTMGYCYRHYERMHKKGDPGPVGSLLGGGYLSQEGYRIISVDGVKIKEHRHVVEQELGRQLEPFENVHHKNGDKADNRLENLELWCVHQPKGQRVADLVSFVADHYPEAVRAALAGKTQLALFIGAP